MRLRSIFATNGESKLIPIDLPFMKPAPQAGTLWQTFKACYLQQLRWKWNVLEIGYVVANCFSRNKVPLKTRIAIVLALFDIILVEIVTVIVFVVILNTDNLYADCTVFDWFTLSLETGFSLDANDGSGIIDEDAMSGMKGVVIVAGAITFLTKMALSPPGMVGFDIWMRNSPGGLGLDDKNFNCLQHIWYYTVILLGAPIGFLLMHLVPTFHAVGRAAWNARNFGYFVSPKQTTSSNSQLTSATGSPSAATSECEPLQLEHNVMQNTSPEPEPEVNGSPGRPQVRRLVLSGELTSAGAPEQMPEPEPEFDGPSRPQRSPMPDPQLGSHAARTPTFPNRDHPPSPGGGGWSISSSNSHSIEEKPVQTLGFPRSRSSSRGSLTNLVDVTESAEEQDDMLIPDRPCPQRRNATTASGPPAFDSAAAPERV